MKGRVLVGVGMSLVLALTLAVTDAEAGAKGRMHRQQHRIKDGAKDGSLTRKEAVRLEVGQARIRRDWRKAHADGDYTARERAKIHREQDRQSRRIYRQKHDGQDRPLRPEPVSGSGVEVQPLTGDASTP